jgi:hypothetical protein
MMVGQKTADEKLTFFACWWQAENTVRLPQLKPTVENVCEALDSGHSSAVAL